jgi:hypothetical protein
MDWFTALLVVASLCLAIPVAPPSETVVRITRAIDAPDPVQPRK